ncbi:MAG: class I SAM-dependent methyltransferase, partial [Nitrososphaerota archaeon]|nr:class I SAM-dependent methyltransferase [Nitrososphaerota archaeon]
EKYDNFDISKVRNRFIREVTEAFEATGRAQGKIRILDVGCGTGRDMRAFLEKGYSVTAIDPSPKMLRICKRKLRHAQHNNDDAATKGAAELSECREMTFDEIPYRSEFHGVWGAASLLHVPHERMAENLRKILKALMPNGIPFISVKFGHGERERDGRYYTHYNMREMRSILKQFPDAEEIRMWFTDEAGNEISGKTRLQSWWNQMTNKHGRRQWLNILAKKTSR